MHTKIIFLSGFFTKEQRQYIETNSIGVIQNAADALQSAYFTGLNSIVPGGIVALNLPFVGSYPRRFRKMYFSGLGKIAVGASTVIGVGFLNISGIKLAARAFAVLIKLTALVRALGTDKKVIVIYSAHLPFLLPALFVGRVFKVKTCVIIPDLPEFMSDDAGVIAISRKLNRSIFYMAVRRVSYAVVLTRHMIERLGLDGNRSIVIEGVSSEPSVEVVVKPCRQIKSILYTGTLDPRYGVLNLIKAFLQISNAESELWICGAGGAGDEISNAANKDSRIKFFGQVTRERSLELQRQATILINPRPADGEFTKYSFPSKIIEYYASGRPVIMYKLDGIPAEYYSYCFSPNGSAVSDLAECIENCLSIPNDDLDALGLAAKKFVLSEKNSVVQGRRLLELITS